MNKMSDELLRVELQRAVDDPVVPPAAEWRRWASAAATAAQNGSGTCDRTLDLTIRLVGSDESERLNTRYRHRDGPTNVLAFGGLEQPDLPDEEQQLGDIVICLPVAVAEARESCKDPVGHLAHLTVHGTLHLLGYNHADDTTASRMERLETAVMAELGYPDPYAS